MLRIILRGLLGTGLALLVSCKPIGLGQNDKNFLYADSAASQESQKILNRSFEIARSTLSYLPFDYRATGCNERAFYVSMELAAQGLVSNRAWIFGKLQYGSAKEESWGNHTAPILTTSDQPTIDNTFVLDYALFDAPQSIRKWTEKSQQFNKSSNLDRTLQLLVVEPANGIPDEFDWLSLFPALLYVDNAEDLDKVFKNYHFAKTLSQITPFNQEEIERSCHTLYHHLGENGLKDSNKRQDLLLERTKNLVSQLQKRGLYRGESLEVSCPDNKYNVTFPPADTFDSKENPVLRAVAACQLPRWSAVEMMNQFYKVNSENQCDALKDYTQSLNLHGNGLKDLKNQSYAKCLHRQLNCKEISNMDQHIQTLLRQSSAKGASCKPVGGSILPRSCEDIKLLSQHYLGARIDLACWQKVHGCLDRLRVLLPSLL